MARSLFLYALSRSHHSKASWAIHVSFLKGVLHVLQLVLPNRTLQGRFSTSVAGHHPGREADKQDAVVNGSSPIRMPLGEFLPTNEARLPPPTN